MAKNQSENLKGFTLVELIIAVALFTLVAFISIGAILSIFDANKRAQASKTVVDNLNIAIENMTRTVRFGKNYYCNPIGSIGIGDTNDCSNGGSSLSVAFYDRDLLRDVRVNYSWAGSGQPIMRSYNGGSDEPITSPEVVIEYLKFYVFGSSLEGEQPYVVAVIKGYSGNKSTTQSRFSIETTMSQRKLDI